MADRIEAFTVTVTAGTLAAAPQTDDLDFADGIVTDIEIIVPDGHAGLTTLALLYGGVQIIPRTPGSAIISNDEVIRWPIEGYPTGSQWRAQTTNTDVFDHSFHLRLLVDELSRPGEGPGAVIVPVAAAAIQALQPAPPGEGGL